MRLLNNATYIHNIWGFHENTSFNNYFSPLHPAILHIPTQEDEKMMKKYPISNLYHEKNHDINWRFEQTD